MKKAILILFLALVAGLMIVAQRSGPKDSLYPIKTGLNEPIIKIFTPLFEKKGLYEIQIAEDRLKETEALAVQGELGDAEQLALERLFETAQDSVLARVKRARGNDSLATAHFLATQYRAVLSAHRHILLVSSSQKPELAEDLERFQYAMEQGMTALEEEIAGLEQVMLNTMEKQEFVKGFDQKYAAAGIAATDASAWVSDHKQALESAKPSIAQQRLDAVDKALAESKKQSDTDLFGAAFISAHAAMTEARVVQTVAEANVRLGIVIGFPEGRLK